MQYRGTTRLDSRLNCQSYPNAWLTATRKKPRSDTIMNEKNLSNLAALGEGYTIEFKRSGTSGLGREICAFANATGGVILIAWPTMGWSAALLTTTA